MKRHEATPSHPDMRQVLRSGWLPALWVMAVTATSLILREAPRSSSHWALLDVLSVAPIAIAATMHGASWAVRRARGGAEEQRAEVASVLHDLRAPLMTARAYLDLLAAESLGPLSADARDAAGRAAIAAARAQALATALAGRRVTPEAAAQSSVALGEVFEDVLAALDAQIRDARSQVEFGDLPTVRGDREALYRVFASLIENALKYRKTDATAPRIVVSASRQRAHWRVADARLGHRHRGRRAGAGLRGADARPRSSRAGAWAGDGAHAGARVGRRGRA